ncbi:hypothetical protein LCGC14_2466690 [marine sediment metagenome]|uniref:Uncharacterized protein n=1 Tax=marine sediment metagenome TaxID=412755 RepID=A0A0F9DNS3_9ZZZZ
MQTKHRLKNDFDAWMLDNADASDEDIEKKVKALTSPAKEEMMGNWFSRLFNIENLFPLVGHKARQAKSIPQPKTQAEYDAIESGTDYIDTDGVRKRKK